MNRLVKFFEGATAPFLAKAAIVAASIVAGLLLSLAAALWFQTWRIGNLQQENGALAAQIDQCVQANATNQTTINELERANLLNRRRAQEALAEQDKAILRAREAESRLAQEAKDDIEAIEDAATGLDCANRPMPDDIRLRVNKGRDRNAHRDESSGAPGPA